MANREPVDPGDVGHELALWLDGLRVCDRSGWFRHARCRDHKDAEQQAWWRTKGQG